jgi:hypothetical protein
MKTADGNIHIWKKLVFTNKNVPTCANYSDVFIMRDLVRHIADCNVGNGNTNTTNYENGHF